MGGQRQKEGQAQLQEFNAWFGQNVPVGENIKELLRRMGPNKLGMAYATALDYCKKILASQGNGGELGEAALKMGNLIDKKAEELLSLGTDGGTGFWREQLIGARATYQIGRDAYFGEKKKGKVPVRVEEPEFTKAREPDGGAQDEEEEVIDVVGTYLGMDEGGGEEAPKPVEQKKVPTPEEQKEVGEEVQKFREEFDARFGKYVPVEKNAAELLGLISPRTLIYAYIEALGYCNGILSDNGKSQELRGAAMERGNRVEKKARELANLAKRSDGSWVERLMGSVSNYEEGKRVMKSVYGIHVPVGASEIAEIENETDDAWGKYHSLIREKNDALYEITSRYGGPWSEAAKTPEYENARKEWDGKEVSARKKWEDALAREKSEIPKIEEKLLTELYIVRGSGREAIEAEIDGLKEELEKTKSELSEAHKELGVTAEVIKRNKQNWGEGGTPLSSDERGRLDRERLEIAKFELEKARLERKIAIRQKIAKAL
ncbi:hypothetical protein JW721_03390 [Candidatus Micrarchaeota archaeon]|nr:hypothetical protein [Candidatus Micrarchaeota archaeon]